MDWHQLQYFQAVARIQHFTRAADMLLISQPALSRSIARLEEELGVPLFERQGRKVYLNRFGKTFLKRVDQAMQEIFEGQKELQDVINPSSGSVSIAFFHTLGTNLVPDLIGNFRKTYPKMKFQLFQNSSQKILDQLEAGELDFCLCSPAVERERIYWKQLLTEELFVIVPIEHKLSKRKKIKLSEIAQDPFIALKKDNGLRKITEQFCKEAGFNPKVTFEGEEVGTIAGLVAAKLGVALIPDVSGLDTNKVSKLRVSQPVCQRSIGLAWVKGRYISPAAKKFKQFILDYFNYLG